MLWISIAFVILLIGILGAAGVIDGPMGLWITMIVLSAVVLVYTGGVITGAVAFGLDKKNENDILRRNNKLEQDLAATQTALIKKEGETHRLTTEVLQAQESALDRYNQEEAIKASRSPSRRRGWWP